MKRFISSLRRPLSSSHRGICTVAEMSNLRPDRGIKGLLSPKGLDIAWYQYQQYVIDSLNKSIQGHAAFEKMASPFEILQASGHSGDFQEIYYWASQAYNNEFFFSALRDSIDNQATIEPPNITDPIAKDYYRHVDISTDVINFPYNLQKSEQPKPVSTFSFSSLDDDTLEYMINESFDSPIAFRELLINRADVMFGNGYVWLVYSHGGGLAVFNTYNGGSPYSFQTQNNNKSNPSTTTTTSTTTQSKRSRSSLYANANELRAQGMTYDPTAPMQVLPILNINAMQHIYLPDYGVYGKLKFLSNAFNCIDWTMVEKRMPQRNTRRTFL